MESTKSVAGVAILRGTDYQPANLAGEPVRCRQCHGVGRPNVAGRLLPGLCPACDGKGYIEQEHETEEQEAHL